MKKLLVLLCMSLILSCGDKEVKNDINELKENNNKYEYYPQQDDRLIERYFYYGDIFNKETGELWTVSGEKVITKIVSEEDLK